MLLAIDTSTRTISIALHAGHALVAESSWRSPDYHTVELAPAVAVMLDRAQTAPGELKGIGVAIGPGSFTGLRIGLALAKGLALAHNVPLVGIPTLEILAHAQPPREEPMLAILQAGRGRVAAGRFTSTPDGWQSEGEVRVVRWPELAASIESPVYVCGEVDEEGMSVLRKLRGKAIIAPAYLSLRRAGALGELAWARLRAGQTDDPVSLAPVYLSAETSG